MIICVIFFVDLLMRAYHKIYNRLVYVSDFNTHRRNIMQPSKDYSKNLDCLVCEESNAAPLSSLVSRNLTISGHRTSVRLEPEMWTGFYEICRREHLSLHEIGSAVSSHKSPNTSLTAALRVFIMAYFRASSTEDGHSKAGHGPGGAFMSAIQYESPIHIATNTNTKNDSAQKKVTPFKSK